MVTVLDFVLLIITIVMGIICILILMDDFKDFRLYIVAYVIALKIAIDIVKVLEGVG